MHSDIIEIRIEGSSGAPYVVTFSRDGEFLMTSCTCPAGERRIHCKHRLALFAGDLTAIRGVISSGLAEQLSAMVRGTQVEVALQELEAAEIEARAAADRLKRAKRFLDRVMHK